MPVDPNTRRAIGAIGGAVACVVLIPVLAPPILGIFGFGAAGPVAGSIAAGIQAGIGNVVAGSAFAVAQSVAMGGAIPAVVTVIGAGVGVGVGTAAAGACTDDDGATEDGADKEKASADVDEGDEGIARTGQNRCRNCKRRRRRYCKHHSSGSQ